MKLVIGLVGEKGSGKDTFVKIFKKNAKDKKVVDLRFSDLLLETLNLWDIPATRGNLQLLAVVMNEGFGEGTLANAIKKRIEKIDADVILLSGIRWKEDVELVRAFSKNLLIYITANVKKRYERLKDTSKKVGEKNVSFAQFMKEEKAKNELLIPKIGSKADYKIVNNGTLEEFKLQVKKLVNDLPV